MSDLQLRVELPDRRRQTRTIVPCLVVQDEPCLFLATRSYLPQAAHREAVRAREEAVEVRLLLLQGRPLHGQVPGSRAPVLA